jgi:RNase P subunit RPR2
MAKYTASRAPAGGGRTKQIVMIVISVVALAIAGVLFARRVTYKEKTVPDFMPVTCKTCGTKFEVPYEVFREARDNKRELVGFCPHCGSEQPCYTGTDPNRLPGQMPPFRTPDE